MGCKHEHLRTVNNRLFCKDCKKELPLEFLTGGKPEEPAPVEEVPAEIPPVEETPAEDAAVVEIPEEIPTAEKKTGKSPAKKRTPKKAQ